MDESAVAAARIVIVGAGPAGVRAAQTLVQAGLRPAVIDEAAASGGQIYRRQPRLFRRSHAAIYGFEAAKAQAIHRCFDAIVEHIDYQPNTMVWNVHDHALYTANCTAQGELARRQPFDALILATGATDRLLPISGWTLPGCYSMGAAQIALKAQACAIGRTVVFVGTGPLLYLVSYQYAKAGAKVAAVLDTSALDGQIKALTTIATRPSLLGKGLYYRAQLWRRGIPVHTNVRPLLIEGAEQVSGIRFQRKDGAVEHVACDAIGMGFHLRSETQLADLARCDFIFDQQLQQWVPRLDRDGRTSIANIYLAGDGARILGADAAEISGELAASAVLKDLGASVDEHRVAQLRRRHQRLENFCRGLALALPWPAHLARSVADEVILCRCEAITAGDLRSAVNDKDAPELNRAKAFTRIGMGRCQGRFCGSAAAEILADARGETLLEVGRLRGQAPVKPLSLNTRFENTE